jgi:uncharacterized protein YlzI (FlbEa/FlbD family)
VIVNSDLIKFIEQAPDTVITLVNGEKILVREPADEVLSRIVGFRRSVLQGVFPAWEPIDIVADKSKNSKPAPGDDQKPAGSED